MHQLSIGMFRQQLYQDMGLKKAASVRLQLFFCYLSRFT